MKRDGTLRLKGHYVFILLKSRLKSEGRRFNLGGIAPQVIAARGVALT